MNPSGQGQSLRDTAAHVAGVYAQDGPDIGFWRILHDLGKLNDERLAELIDEDGRIRIARGLPVDIERYMEAVPDLFDRCDAVDAAVDVTLRSRCGSARFDAEAVEALIDEYPQLETIIREAVALNNAMRSSYAVQANYPVPKRRVPQDFGPIIETGESRYELRRVLGIGSTGQVYLAIDRLLSEKDRPALVAIKVLNPRKRNRAYRDRLIEEARKARRVDHPNVVRVLDLGVTDEEEDYIAYEFVTGGDLFQWLQDRGNRPDPREAAALMAKVGRGLQAAHAAGLVHCDLNPGNIILTEDGLPKIADFGVAIRAEEARRQGPEQRAADEPVGNMLFISPEQYRCEDGSLTVPSDVYTLGGLLFTLLTAALPNGELDEIEKTHHAVNGRTEAPSARALRPEIDRDLDAICQRALAPRPDQRHSSAGAFADDLEAFLRHEPIPWTRPSPLRIARLWARRKPAVAAISLLLALSVVSFGGLALSENQRRQAEEIRAIEAERARQAEELRAIEAEHARQAEELRAIEAEHARQAEELRAIEAEQARRTEEFRAEVERMRAEEQRALNRQAASIASEIVGLLETAQHEGPSTLFLPVIWTVEYFLQKNVLDPDEMPDDLAAARLRIVERLVHHAEASGRGDDLEAMLWRSTLAFWLVAAGDLQSLDRAEAMLDRLHGQWSGVLRDGDSWLAHLDAIRSCARIKRVMHAADHEALDETATARLRHHRAALERYEPVLATDDPGSPLHALLLDTMVELYAFVGDEDAGARAVARRQQVAARRPISSN